MTVLAGLAYHQSGGRLITPADESALTGTAIQMDDEADRADELLPERGLSGNEACGEDRMASKETGQQSCEPVSATAKSSTTDDKEQAG